MTAILDQQFIVHLYAPAQGPDAEAAYHALQEIWTGCRLVLRMSEPVPGTGLPHFLPPDPAELAGGSNGGGEVALAAQERPAADCQAILRRHHDLLNLSVALAPPEASAPDGADWPWWQALDRQWTALTADRAAHLLGEARLYLARVDARDAVHHADPALIDRLAALLPESARGLPGAQRGVPIGDGLAFWETSTQPDERPLRRFVLALAPDADSAASAWVWSRGDPAIPPLGRYLLHAARLRYELRVWQRDGQTRSLHASLDALGSELLRLGASNATQAELLRLRGLDATLLQSELRELRHTVEIAADNLGRAFDLSGLTLPGGPFADDADLAGSFLEQLHDEIAYLGFAGDRAAGTMAVSRAAQPATRPATRSAPEASPAPAGQDRARKVFVVHGRDEAARIAVTELIAALGLDPVDWDESVGATGQPMPFLGQVLEEAIPLVQAVVVVMSPDDVVRLHPSLHGPGEPHAETSYSLQARPNVLVELGMALAVHPRRTLILLIGSHRLVTDLGGRNYVRVAEGLDFRRRIGNRLKLAGCPVQMPEGGAWQTAGAFSELSAHRRAPHAPR